MKYNHSDHICVTRDDLFVDEKKRKGAVARFFVQQPLFALGVFNEPLARGKRNKAKRKEQLGESVAALFLRIVVVLYFRPLTGIWF